MVISKNEYLLEHREAVEGVELIVKGDLSVSGTFQAIKDQGLLVARSDELPLSVGSIDWMMDVLIMTIWLLWNWCQTI